MIRTLLSDIPDFIMTVTQDVKLIRFKVQPVKIRNEVDAEARIIVCGGEVCMGGGVMRGWVGWGGVGGRERVEGGRGVGGKTTTPRHALYSPKITCP